MVKTDPALVEAMGGVGVGGPENLHFPKVFATLSARNTKNGALRAPKPSFPYGFIRVLLQETVPI